MPEIKLLHGDCSEVLSRLPDNSVDSVVTDPPAGIGFMGKAWDGDKGGRDAWVTWLAGVMAEVKRVLKPGGHALVWALPRTSHWTATAVENAGFEIRDVVTHVFGSGFPKSMDVSKAIDFAAGAEREIIGVDQSKLRPNRKYKSGAIGTDKVSDRSDNGATITRPTTDDAKKWNGWGTALKPASEHWILARKPLTEKTVAANVLKWGTGAINVDDCRIGTEQLNYRTTSYREAATGEFSSRGHTNFTTGQKTVGGRFPSNFTLSCTDACTESKHEKECPVYLLDEQSGITTSGAMKHEVSAYDGDSNTGFLRGRSGPSNQHGDSGGASRFFYCAKPSKKERNMGLDSKNEPLTEHGARPQDWENQDWSKVNGNHHPTVKPLKLLEYLVTLITPKGGTVLDMFMGSGSTGLACVSKNFNFVGIEQEQEYFDIASKRIDYAKTHKESSLFDEESAGLEKTE